LRRRFEHELQALVLCLAAHQLLDIPDQPAHVDRFGLDQDPARLKRRHV
jgi:hypothetical protein